MEEELAQGLDEAAMLRLLLPVPPARLSVPRTLPDVVMVDVGDCETLAVAHALAETRVEAVDATLAVPTRRLGEGLELTDGLADLRGETLGVLLTLRLPVTLPLRDAVGLALGLRLFVAQALAVELALGLREALLHALWLERALLVEEVLMLLVIEGEDEVLLEREREVDTLLEALMVEHGEVVPVTVLELLPRRHPL